MIDEEWPAVRENLLAELSDTATQGARFALKVQLGVPFMATSESRLSDVTMLVSHVGKLLTDPGIHRWRLACFDLDGTLVRGTSVSQHLADRFGQGEQMAELERRYTSGEISNAVVAEETGRSYRGVPLPQVIAKLSDIACIEGIDSTLATLRERGIESLLGTVTWSFAAQEFGRRHGFAAVSGTEIELDSDGIPTGNVKRHFDEWDKLAFVAAYGKANGIDLAECIAIGDSRSDIPLFDAVGFSIAINATTQARDAASVALDTDDLNDVLDLIPWE